MANETSLNLKSNELGVPIRSWGQRGHVIRQVIG